MALDLFILVERQQLDQGSQESRIDDRGFVRGVDRHVSDTSSGGENEREVRGVQEPEEGFQAVGFDDLELILFYSISTVTWGNGAEAHRHWQGFAAQEQLGTGP